MAKLKQISQLNSKFRQLCGKFGPKSFFFTIRCPKFSWKIKDFSPKLKDFFLNSRICQIHLLAMSKNRWKIKPGVLKKPINIKVWFSPYIQVNKLLETWKTCQKLNFNSMVSPILFNYIKRDQSSLFECNCYCYSHFTPK